MGGHAENPSSNNDFEVAASLESGSLRKGLIILVCRDVVFLHTSYKSCVDHHGSVKWGNSGHIGRKSQWDSVKEQM